MLVRYSVEKSPEGREFRRKALVYTAGEHGIQPGQVDPDAMRVIRRLRRSGYQAYVVGGAVRDLLVGITPKDFDLATNAHPAHVRKLFRSARIIGRRFRLVHVYCGHEKYLEVATFRSAGDGDGENRYGSIAEDAARRDFTLNALFYCPLRGQVVDYVGGVQDIRARRMRTIVPEMQSFREDPVRMIRAVKHTVQMGFRMPLRMRRAIRRLRHLVSGCSAQRVTEEIYKILRCGRSRGVMELAFRLGLLDVMLPALHALIRQQQDTSQPGVLGRLAEVDATEGEGSRALDTGQLLAALLEDFTREPLAQWAREQAAQPEPPPAARGRSRRRRRPAAPPRPPIRLVEHALRQSAAPLIPSNRDLRRAASVILDRWLSAPP